mmetsp:Transcript_12317/g.23881  ORF Transcript_12317/g.23881 Transcript_12317/m.23881 type:complete len:97 (-) Transcript_12317:2194-2484(-)
MSFSWQAELLERGEKDELKPSQKRSQMTQLVPHLDQREKMSKNIFVMKRGRKGRKLTGGLSDAVGLGEWMHEFIRTKTTARKIWAFLLGQETEMKK